MSDHVVKGKFTLTIEGHGDICTARCGSLNIDVHARTVEELLGTVKEDIDALWFSYALADDNELTLDAQEVKRKLLETFEEGA